MSNSNNRMIVFASILGAILATGILALNPSTITNAGAQMYDDQYGYEDDDNYSQDDYQQRYDDDNYYNQDYNDYGYDDYADNSKVQLEFADKYGDNYHKDYSKHPTKDHKFVCKTGQFKGFFVKSPAVCNLEIPEGPEGAQGEQGIQGEQGPAGPVFLNTTNVYLNQSIVNLGPNSGIYREVLCDDGDFVLNGGYFLRSITFGEVSADGPITGPNDFSSSEPGSGWAFLGGFSSTGSEVTVSAFCFDNPPAHVP